MSSILMGMGNSVSGREILLRIYTLLERQIHFDLSVGI